jgi:hypothetical protein
MAEKLEKELLIKVKDNLNMIEAALNAFKRRRSIVTRNYSLQNSIKKDELFS